jgi:hypothetical protein
MSRDDGPTFPLLEQSPELDARCQFCGGEGLEVCETPGCELVHPIAGIHHCTPCRGSGLSRSLSC